MPQLLVTRREDVAVLTPNRPDAGNRLTTSLANEIALPNNIIARNLASMKKRRQHLVAEQRAADVAGALPFPRLRPVRIGVHSNRPFGLGFRNMSTTTAETLTRARLSRAELRERWLRMIEDPLLAAIPYKVELNEKGAIEVSPASNRHGILQAFVARELGGRRPYGTTMTECSVETRIGVRVPDVAWASPEFVARHGVTTPFPGAPEICVEVLSPSNTEAQIKEKAAAYLEAGASEVWLVSDDRGIEIITKSGPRASSAFRIDLVLPP